MERDFMEALAAVKHAAFAARLPVYEVAQLMGRSPSYISAAIARGSTPKADTLAAMLEPCGYVLAALPREDAPASALVIDPPARE